jgi:hypothetical protein
MHKTCSALKSTKRQEDLQIFALQTKNFKQTFHFVDWTAARGLQKARGSRGPHADEGRRRGVCTRPLCRGQGARCAGLAGALVGRWPVPRATECPRTGGPGHGARVTLRPGRGPDPSCPTLSPLCSQRLTIQLKRVRTQRPLLAPCRSRVRRESRDGRAAARLGHHHDCARLWGRRNDLKQNSHAHRCQHISNTHFADQYSKLHRRR